MDKRLELLEYLLTQKRIVSNRELQAALTISKRTVINYVKELNSLTPNIIHSSNQGYLCPNSSAAQETIGKLQSTQLFDNYSKRRDYLFKELLLKATHPSLEELADQMYISTATLNNELGRLRNELKEHSLYLKTKNNRLFIIGQDQDKRRFTMLLLNQELKQSHFKLENMQKFFQHVTINDISKMVQNTLRKHSYFLDDFSFLNYVLHLAICTETTLFRREVPDMINKVINNYPFTPHILEIVKEIHQNLMDIYHTDISFTQVLDASVLMTTRIRSVNLSTLNFEQIKTIIPAQACGILFKIITAVHSIYGIDLKADNFMVRFAFHLNSLMDRAANSLVVPENYFITIKNDYPFLYVIAEYIASIIGQEIHVTLPENEISYIALHLGVLMEEKNNAATKINCVMVLYDYYNMGVTIFEHIKQLAAPVNLYGIVTSYEQIQDLSSVDLIITTLPENPDLGIPIIKIHMLPTRQDYETILLKATELTQNIHHRELTRQIQQIFKKELFFPHTNFSSWEEAIRYLCEKMESSGYVDKAFHQEILYHEQVAPSAYRNVALPHPLTADESLTRISSIAVALNDRPISWDKNQVDFIFLLSLRGEDRQLFKDVFTIISSFLQSDYNCQLLKSCDSFDTFINLIIST